tara:strand:+ start:636 stop:818 length:183 start_codon:yes stop_codon:yes gene_type:complete
LNLKEIKTMKSVKIENLEVDALLKLYYEARKRADATDNFKDIEYWILIARKYSKIIKEIK